MRSLVRIQVRPPLLPRITQTPLTFSQVKPESLLVMIVEPSPTAQRVVSSALAIARSAMVVPVVTGYHFSPPSPLLQASPFQPTVTALWGPIYWTANRSAFRFLGPYDQTAPALFVWRMTVLPPSV